MAGLLKFSSIALKNLFTKPATRNYPELPPKSTAATRGSVQVDIDVCVFCGLCMRRCPSEAIKVDRNAKSWSIERMGCVQCADCVSICPKKCLSMNPKYTAPSSTKKIDVYQKELPLATPEEMVVSQKSASALLMNMDNCVLCGLCVKQCPVGAIKVDRTTKTWTIDRTNCLLCGACAQRCPKKCLTVGSVNAADLPSVYSKGAAAASSIPAAEPKVPSAEPKAEANASPAPAAKKGETQAALMIGIENCVLCGMCVKQCPVGAITVDRASKTWTIDRANCLLCGACAQRCPKKCLGIGQASEATTQTSVYTKS